MLQRLPKGEAVTDLVRRLLAGELCNGEPTLEEYSSSIAHECENLAPTA
jgi:hypothetical protein